MQTISVNQVLSSDLEMAIRIALSIEGDVTLVGSIDKMPILTKEGSHIRLDAGLAGDLNIITEILVSYAQSFDYTFVVAFNDVELRAKSTTSPQVLQAYYQGYQDGQRQLLAAHALSR